MSVVDLRQLGEIDATAEAHLATLIAQSCSQDKIKHQLSLCACRDFGWDNGLLANYVLAGLMTTSSTRVEGFISSGEWLCGIFTSGEQLSTEHLMILMSYINPYVSSLMILAGEYESGKEAWKQTPSSIKKLLDLLDDCLLTGRSVTVAVPTIVPLDPLQSIDTLEYLPLNELYDKVKIVWSTPPTK